jgi:hypothetical protein
MLSFPPLWGELCGLLLWLLNFTFPSVFVSHTSMMAQIIEDKKGGFRKPSLHGFATYRGESKKRKEAA